MLGRHYKFSIFDARFYGELWGQSGYSHIVRRVQSQRFVDRSISRVNITLDINAKTILDLRKDLGECMEIPLFMLPGELLFDIDIKDDGGRILHLCRATTNRQVAALSIVGICERHTLGNYGLDGQIAELLFDKVISFLEAGTRDARSGTDGQHNNEYLEVMDMVAQLDVDLEGSSQVEQLLGKLQDSFMLCVELPLSKGLEIQVVKIETKTPVPPFRNYRRPSLKEVLESTKAIPQFLKVQIARGLRNAKQLWSFVAILRKQRPSNIASDTDLITEGLKVDRDGFDSNLSASSENTDQNEHGFSLLAQQSAFFVTSPSEGQQSPEIFRFIPQILGLRADYHDIEVPILGVNPYPTHFRVIAPEGTRIDDCRLYEIQRRDGRTSSICEVDQNAPENCVSIRMHHERVVVHDRGLKPSVYQLMVKLNPRRTVFLIPGCSAALLLSLLMFILLLVGPFRNPDQASGFASALFIIPSATALFVANSSEHEFVSLVAGVGRTLLAITSGAAVISGALLIAVADNNSSTVLKIFCLISVTTTLTIASFCTLLFAFQIYRIGATRAATKERWRNIEEHCSAKSVQEMHKMAMEKCVKKVTWVSGLWVLVTLSSGVLALILSHNSWMSSPVIDVTANALAISV